MVKLLTALRQTLFPPVPDAIRDDFILLTAGRLQSQSRLLFLALFATVPTAIYAGSETASTIVRYILPLIMGAACLAGFFRLSKDLRISDNVRRAGRLIQESIWVSSALAVVCSSWCVFSWLTSPEATRVYYPLILSMGSLATAYCLSSIRRATILNLGIGLIPISTLLLFSGDRMNVAAGTSLLVATGFLLRMIVQQHQQLVDLLMLERQMRDLANTDPLTGLLNRRALDIRLEAEVAQAGPDSSFSIALIDLDGFKPINDRFGHATGDLLLQETADRLRAICAENGFAARQGGDEFAILVPAGSPLDSPSLPDQILKAITAPCLIGDKLIRVGASIGTAHWPEDGTTIRALFETADRALYAAKPVETVRTAAIASLPRLESVKAA